jgi:hypothetical protein
MDKNMLTTLYKSIVRPQLEYGSNIWSVMYKKEAIQIENVQRRATKLGIIGRTEMYMFAFGFVES